MLFAEADATVFAVSMALISSLSSLGTAYIAYLTGKSKLDSDGERVAMKAEIKACEEDRKELRDEIATLRRRIDDLTGNYRTLPPAA